MKEETQRIKTIENAKLFMNDLRSTIEEIVGLLNSTNEQDQLNGATNTYAISECLKQYKANMKDIFERFERVEQLKSSTNFN